MARIQFTGTGKAYFVTPLSSTTSPTAVQIIAGTDLTPFLRQDGLNRSQDSGLVDTATAANLFETTDIGTRSAKLELTLYRDSETADDDAWAALEIGNRGFLVVLPFGGGGALGVHVAADRCEVWPVAIANRSNSAIAKDAAQVFTVSCAVTSAPVDDAVVA